MIIQRKILTRVGKRVCFHLFIGFKLIFFNCILFENNPYISFK